MFIKLHVHLHINMQTYILIYLACMFLNACTFKNIPDDDIYI